MILSFMIVWDLPTISAGASSLRTSRLAPFYNELAPILGVFGQLFGKALQAQVSPLEPSTALHGYSRILQGIQNSVRCHTQSLLCVKGFSGFS